MTLDEWKTIKTNQTIYSVSTGKKRFVVRGCGNNLCVALKPIGKTWYQQDVTVYDKQSRNLFSLYPKKKEKKDDDFYTLMLNLGIAETRIFQLIESLNSLHQSLVLLDEDNLEKLQQIGSLDNLFELFLKHSKCSKKVSLKGKAK
jgi:hypothetical protein